MRSILFLFLLLLLSCDNNNDDKVFFESEQINFVSKQLDFINPDSSRSIVKAFINDNNLMVDGRKLDDGVYTGVLPEGGLGYYYVLKFLVENGKIKKAFYNEVTNSGSSKREDIECCEMMEAANEGSAPYNAFSFYEKELLLKQNICSIDVVTGATYSLCRMQMAFIKAIHTKDE